jgi:hypothetical protein
MDTHEIAQCEADRDNGAYLDVYLFYDDETATIMNEPVARVPLDTEELSGDVVRAILIQCLKENGLEEYVELAAKWEEEKATDAMYDLCTLILDSAALVEQKHAETIELVGAELSKLFGNDSDTYGACGVFNALLKSLAVRVISFPEPDFERGDEWDYRT